MRLRLLSVVPLVTLAVCAVACADGSAGEAEGQSEVSALSNLPTVGGYDLGGPQRLAAELVGTEACHIVTAERTACERAEGLVVRANGCKDLCSKPIAPDGQTAGYDGREFKIRPSGHVIAERCASGATTTTVQDSCARVGGTTSRADGCELLCSLPF